MTVLSTIVGTLPDRPCAGPMTSGSCTPVALSCGHVFEGNQSMTFKAGWQTRCDPCSQTATEADRNVPRR